MTEHDLKILKQPGQPDSGKLSEDDSRVGLTDDERVSREAEPEGEGARVEPGPADKKRLPKH